MQSACRDDFFCGHWPCNFYFSWKFWRENFVIHFVWLKKGCASAKEFVQHFWIKMTSWKWSQFGKIPISCNVKLIFPLTDFYLLKEEKKRAFHNMPILRRRRDISRGTNESEEVKEKLADVIVTQCVSSRVSRSQILVNHAKWEEKELKRHYRHLPINPSL